MDGDRCRTRLARIASAIGQEAPVAGTFQFSAFRPLERLENAANGSPWIAWVTSSSRVRGQSGGKAMDLFSTETMVLKREEQGWRIAHQCGVPY